VTVTLFSVMAAGAKSTMPPTLPAPITGEGGPRRMVISPCSGVA
jgi:hypothetical protein